MNDILQGGEWIFYNKKNHHKIAEYVTFKEYKNSKYE